MIYQITESQHFIRVSFPMIPPRERHGKEAALEAVGLNVNGGGTDLVHKKSDIFIVRDEILSLEDTKALIAKALSDDAERQEVSDG